MTEGRTMGSHRTRSAVAMALPASLGITVFFVAPALAVVLLAGFQWDLLSTPRWVGAANMTAILGDPATARATLVTGSIAALSLTIEIGVGFLLGLALRRLGPARSARTLILLPWMIAPLAVGAVARWVFAPSDGVLALLLGHRIDLLVDPIGAPIVVALVSAWQATGLAAVLYATALSAIPREIRDAAALDGAGGVSMVRFIDWPLVAPVTLVLVMTAAIRAFGLYDLVVPLTGGGPDGATLTLSALIVQKAWVSFDVGQAAALATVTLAIEAVVVGALLLILRRRSFA